MTIGWTPDPLRGYLPPEAVRPHSHEQLRAPERPWKDYDPTLGNVTIGNGGIKGRYKMLDGRTMTGRVHLQLGSTSSVDGTIQIGLPPGWIPSGGVAPNGTGGLDQVTLAVAAPDAFRRFLGVVRFESIGPFSSGATVFTIADANAFWDADVPFSWGSGNELLVNFTIEVEPI
jgi:hypothetical protein